MLSIIIINNRENFGALLHSISGNFKSIMGIVIIAIGCPWPDSYCLNNQCSARPAPIMPA